MWLLLKIRSAKDWVTGLSGEEKKRYISYTAFALLAALYLYTSVQLGQAESELETTQEALATAESAKRRLEREAAINETLRVRLDERLNEREETLRATEEQMGQELQEVKEEYQKLLATYNPNQPDLGVPDNDTVNDDQRGFCYVQVENIARRAAASTAERMWSFYRDQVRTGTDRP